MAVPADPTTVTLYGDYLALATHVIAGDETEERFQVEVSWNNGTDWEHSGWMPAGATWYTIMSPQHNSTVKTRVTAINSSGSSATVECAAAVAVTEPPGVDPVTGTDVVIFTGELVDGTAVAASAAGLTAAGLSTLSMPSKTLNEVAQQVRLLYDDDQTLWWSARVNGGALPLRPNRVFIWNHFGNPLPITAVTPNAPSAGNTQITVSGGVGRQVGATFYVLIKGTGVTNMDDLEFEVEVTGSTTVKISSFTASSSSATGTMHRPSVDLYDSDVNGATNFRSSGTYPCKYYGLESEVARRMQDQRSAILGNSSLNSVVVVKVATGAPILSRVVGGATSSRRWSKRHQGKSGSVFDEYERILADLKSWMDEFSGGGVPAPYRIAGIVVGMGVNETASNVAALRATKTVAAATVATGTVTIRTSTAHGFTNDTGKLYNLAKFSSIGGTLGAALDGNTYAISVVDSDEFTILEFDGTGLSASVTSSSAVEIGSPLFWLQDLAAEHITDLRDTAIVQLDSPQDPADIPVAILSPTTDEDERWFREVFGTAPQQVQAALDAILFPIAQAAVAGAASSLESVGVVDLEGVPHKNSAGGLLLSQYYSGQVGTYELGRRAYERLTNVGEQTSSTGRPAVVVTLIGHSFVPGRSIQSFALDGDPELLSKTGEEIAGFYVWNQTTQEIEPIVVDPDISPTYGGYSNVNSSPVYNPGQSGQAGAQLAILQELHARFPDHDIYLLNLGIGGALASAHASVIPEGDAITGVSAGTSTVTITAALRGSNNPIRRTSSFPVVISGVSGVSPSINGTFIATPTSVSTLPPPSNGTRTFTIPIASVTGTPVLTSARVRIPEAVWDPDAGDVWTYYQQEVDAFFDALHVAGVRPDSRAAFIMLGENDAAAGIPAATYKASMLRLIDSLRDALTTRAAPRAELAVVLMQLINHGRTTLDSEVIAAYQAVQNQIADADPYCVICNVDEQNDRLDDRVTISDDNIHPDYKGMIALGWEMARRLDGVSAWDAPINFALSGSGSAPTGVTP